MAAESGRSVGFCIGFIVLFAVTLFAALTVALLGFLRFAGLFALALGFLAFRMVRAAFFFTSARAERRHKGKNRHRQNPCGNLRIHVHLEIVPTKQGLENNKY